MYLCILELLFDFVASVRMLTNKQTDPLNFLVTYFWGTWCYSQKCTRKEGTDVVLGDVPIPILPQTQKKLLPSPENVFCRLWILSMAAIFCVCADCVCHMRLCLWTVGNKAVLLKPLFWVEACTMFPPSLFLFSFFLYVFLFWNNSTFERSLTLLPLQLSFKLCAENEYGANFEIGGMHRWGHISHFLYLKQCYT